MHIPAWDLIGCLWCIGIPERSWQLPGPGDRLCKCQGSVISVGPLCPKSDLKKSKGLSKTLGFYLGYHFSKAVRQLFGGGEMIQDAKNPIQFGEKLTREFADPTIFLNLQPSL